MTSSSTDYTQNGEFRIIEEVLGGMEHGWAVDVGASDGILINNTKALEERGWEVLCIEPNPLYFDRLTQNRKRVLPVAVSDEYRDFVPFTVIEHWLRGWEAGSALAPRWEILPLVRMPEIRGKQVMPVAVRTLDWCLEHAGFERLDMVSIDTEGNELKVLKGFDIKRWVPKLVIVENWLDDPAIRDYFLGAGYHRQCRLDFNDLYVRDDA